MNTFDDHADGYIAEVDAVTHFSGKGAEFFARRKAEVLYEGLRREGMTPEELDVLDIGCGVGMTDTYLVDRVRHLDGVDTSNRSLEAARVRNPSVQYSQSNAEAELPYAAGRFDVAFAICVLHHVEPTDRLEFIKEGIRVVSEGGRLVIMEHNPYNPLTRRVVRNCDFDRDVELLSKPECERLCQEAGLELRVSGYMTFFPFDGLERLEWALRRVPLGAQYWVSMGRSAAKRSI